MSARRTDGQNELDALSGPRFGVRYDDPTRLVGLPSLGQRMLARDGALALAETLRRDTAMGEVTGDRLLGPLDDVPAPHKLDACRDALADHDPVVPAACENATAVAREARDRIDAD